VSSRSHASMSEELAHTLAVRPGVPSPKRLVGISRCSARSCRSGTRFGNRRIEGWDFSMPLRLPQPSFASARGRVYCPVVVAADVVASSLAGGVGVEVASVLPSGDAAAGVEVAAVVEPATIAELVLVATLVVATSSSIDVVGGGRPLSTPCRLVGLRPVILRALAWGSNFSSYEKSPSVSSVYQCGFVRFLGWHVCSSSAVCRDSSKLFLYCHERRYRRWD
jgi:hypothetical protein